MSRNSTRIDLERVNRGIRRGAIVSLGFMLLLVAGMTWGMVFHLHTPVDRLAVLILTAIVIGPHAYWAIQMLGTTVTPAGVERKLLLKLDAISWNEVHRVSFARGAIQLERQDASSLKLWVFYVSDAHSLQNAVLQLAPRDTELER
jgi:hypothetical protein